MEKPVYANLKLPIVMPKLPKKSNFWHHYRKFFAFAISWRVGQKRQDIKLQLFQNMTAKFFLKLFNYAT